MFNSLIIKSMMQTILISVEKELGKKRKYQLDHGRSVCVCVE